MNTYLFLVSVLLFATSTYAIRNGAEQEALNSKNAHQSEAGNVSSKGIFTVDPRDPSFVEELVKSDLLLKNASPAADSDASSRSGAVTTVQIPSQEPYPITYTSVGPFTSVLPPQYGNDLMSHKMRKQLLDAHNYVRKLETNAATYMTKLTWDFSLEAYALQWTQYLCTASGHRYFEHSPDSAGGTPAWPFRTSTGENLYTTTGERDASWDPSDVVYKWYEEKEYYDWNTGKAAAGHQGKPVGHYKQLVRQQATAVGCAAFSGCKSHPDWRTFVACHYDHGNIGKDPYERRPSSRAGVVCDECPQGFSCCESGLCDGKLPTTSNSLEPHQVATDSSSDWHYCKAHRRTKADCQSTGMLKHLTSVPGDTYDIEFNTCQCGSGVEDNDQFSLVATGLFWYRNHCYKVSTASGYSSLQVISQRRLRGSGNNGGYEREPRKLISTSELENEMVFMDKESEGYSGGIFLQEAMGEESLATDAHRFKIANGVHVDPPPLSQYRLNVSKYGEHQRLPQNSLQSTETFLEVHLHHSPHSLDLPPAETQEVEDAALRAEAISKEAQVEASRVSKSGNLLDNGGHDPQETVVKVSSKNGPKFSRERNIDVVGEGEVEETI